MIFSTVNSKYSQKQKQTNKKSEVEAINHQYFKHSCFIVNLNLQMITKYKKKKKKMKDFLVEVLLETRIQVL